MAEAAMKPDSAQVPAASPEVTPAPVRTINPETLVMLGQQMQRLFEQYRADRNVAEQKWLKNLRQYLGIYDSDIKIPTNMSQAYPRLTRVKVISTVARLMNLMFPGNERNWQLSASPSPDMSPDDVMAAIQEVQQRFQQSGAPFQLTDEIVEAAIMELAEKRAKKLSKIIDDQLQEIGGDQTLDHIALARKVVQSGCMYGMGVLFGPFVRQQRASRWRVVNGQPMVVEQTIYKPMYEFLPVWDVYCDMSAKTIWNMDGTFIRKVMTRSQLRALANRKGFMGPQIQRYIKNTPQGNYKPQAYETELRSMGVKTNVNEMKAETAKYEVLVWYGPVSGQTLADCGANVPDSKLADDVDAEIWMIDGNVIKADINAWRQIGVNMRMAHFFIFDEDDTGPIGNGIPDVVRDSQMSICAATRMLLDNASVVCGPNAEVNLDLLLPEQDTTGISAYKIWYREGMGADANVPAVRSITFDSHMDELLRIIELFMKFADIETFVGPATGGDMERKSMSEPMRTAAGASMIRSDAALPFKDIVRNFDTFTQSVIQSLVAFNKVFNADQGLEGDYNVIARGATSLIAKEVRGMQLDMLSQTLTPEERMYIDDQKFVEQKFAVRDMTDMLLPQTEVERIKAQNAAMQQEQKEMMQQQFAAELRGVMADAFKAITQGQKNAAAADAQTVASALDVLIKGVEYETIQNGGEGASGGSSSSGKGSGE